MSDEKSEIKRLDRIGLHPIEEPLGRDGHHTEVPITAEDREIASALAYILGSLFADIEGEQSLYKYREMSAVDEWSRVARALRIHGLSISDRVLPVRRAAQEIKATPEMVNAFADAFVKWRDGPRPFDYGEGCRKIVGAVLKVAPEHPAN